MSLATWERTLSINSLSRGIVSEGKSKNILLHSLASRLILGQSNRTVRLAKVASTQRRYSEYGARVEIVGFDDLIHGDYSLILKGKRRKGLAISF